jgi:hypothetical protein
MKQKKIKSAVNRMKKIPLKRISAAIAVWIAVFGGDNR